MILLFLTVLSFNIYPLKPSVINGLKTQDFQPVVKITMGNQFRKNINPKYRSLCTGTFIKKGLILTSAHCLENLYFQLKGYYKAHGSILMVNHSLSVNRKEIEIYISDEKKPRALSFELHPYYKKYLEKKMEKAQAFDQLIKKLKRKKITQEAYEKEFFLLQSKAVQEEKSSRNYNYDLAIIKVKPRVSDRVYPVSFSRIQEKTPVVTVGFGLSIDPRAHNFFQELLRKYKKERVKLNLEKPQTFLEKSKNTFELWRVEEKIRKLEKSLHFNRSGIKRFGSNSIGSIGDHYLVKGRRKPYQNLSSWLKSFLDDSEKLRGSPNSLNVSTSNGDSGGPLLITEDGKYYIIGVTRGGLPPNSSNESISIFAKLNLEENQDFIEGGLDL